MSEKDLKFFPGGSSLRTPREYNAATAKTYKIATTQANIIQYKDTIKACIVAGYPVKYVANAGVQIGDNVEELEVNANIQLGTKQGGIVESGNNIIAWQDRGERISVAAELPADPTQGTNVVSVSSGLTQNQQSGPQERKIIEGIGVYVNKPTQITGGNADYSELTNSPFLKANADLKKAA